MEVKIFLNCTFSQTFTSFEILQFSFLFLTNSSSSVLLLFKSQISSTNSTLAAQVEEGNKQYELREVAGFLFYLI